jgi:hypothetical protein
MQRGIAERDMFDHRAGQCRKLGDERVPHLVKAGGIAAAGIDLSPGDQQIA